MSSEASPSYEIGHFEVSNPQKLRFGLKYIVQHITNEFRYILHTDDKEDLHIAVAEYAKVDPEMVIGGGKISRQGLKGDFYLHGFSERFKQEPAEVRDALCLVINEKIKQLFPELFIP